MLNATIKGYQDTESNDRRCPGDLRIAIDRDSTLRGADGNAFTPRVENFSSRRFRFSARGCDFEVGMPVRIGLDGAGAQEARIVCRMARSFSPAEIAPGAFDRRHRVRGGVDEMKWPGSVRLAFLLSGAIGSWVLVYLLAKILIL